MNEEHKDLEEEEQNNELPDIDESAFEDIGAPLTASTDLTLSKPTGAGTTALGISGYNNNLYALWARTGAATPYVIRKYSATGTYDATGDIAISSPTTAPSGETTGSFSSFSGLAIFNNKIYIGSNWSTANTGVVCRYSITGTFEALLFPYPGNKYNDIFIKDNILYSTLSTVGRVTNSYYIINRNLSTQSFVTNVIPGSTTTEFLGYAVSDIKLYVSQGSNILVYDTKRRRISDDDISASSFSYMTVIGSILYCQKSDGNIARYTGIVIPSPITAMWGAPSFNSSSGSIIATITFSAEPAIISDNFYQVNSDFQIEVRSGTGTSGDPYTWTTSSNWFIFISGSGITREITARSPDSVVAGTYRITLAANALTRGQPSATVSTSGQSVPARPSITFAGPANSHIRGLSYYNNNFYVLWNTGASNPYIIRKYSSTGTYDTTGDISIARPTTPPSGYSGGTFSSINGFDISNNKIYINQVWLLRSPRIIFVPAISRYSITGTFESTVITDTNNIDNTYDLAIDGTTAIVTARLSIPRSPQTFFIRIYNLSDGSIIRSTDATNTPIYQGIAPSTSKIYICDHTGLIRVYDKNLNRITSEDIQVSSSYIRGAVAGTTVYFGNNPIYPFGSTVTEITASWNPTTPNYNTTTRAISSDITFSSAPTTFATTGFQVDKRSGAGTSGDPYTWAEETTGWTITAGSGTTTRTITATPDSTVEAGTYRITLPINGLGTSQPTAAASTSGRSVAASIIVATAAWSNTEYADGKLQGTLTFSGANVTNIATTDFAVINSSDTEQSGWSIELPTGVTTATAGTGIIIKATPPTSPINDSFSIRLKQESVRSDGSTTDNAPAANVDFTTDIAIDTRTAIDVTSFALRPSPPSTTTASSATRDFQLILNRAIPRAQLDINDFTVPSGITVASVTGLGQSSTPASVYIVVVNQPDDSMGSYTVALKANAIAAGTDYLAGPVSGDSQRTTASISYDRRSALDVESFALKSDTTTTSYSSTREFTLEFNQSIPANQLSTTDFVVTGITSTVSINPTAGSQDTYTITVNQPSDSNGSYTIALNANSVVAGNTYLAGPVSSDSERTTASTAYDTRDPIVATAAWSSVSFSSGKLTGTLTFTTAGPRRSTSITGITAADFEVLDSSDTPVDPAWTFDTPDATATSGTGIEISATPPSGTDASFKLRLKMTSVRSDGSATDNAPLANVDSTAVDVDNSGEVALSGPSGYTANALSSYNNNIYVLWIRNSPRSYIIRKYSESGVYDSDGDITIGNPTGTPSNYGSGSLSTLSGLEFYNDSIYICAIFSNGTAVAEYSLTGTFDSWTSHLGAMVGGGTNTGRSFRTINIRNGIVYIGGSTGPIANPTSYWIQTWKPFSRDPLSTPFSTTSSSTAPRAMTASNYRSYLTQSGNNNLLAYTIDPTNSTSVSADNINAGRTFTDLTLSGDTLYGLSGSTLYRYSNLYIGEITEEDPITLTNIPTGFTPQQLAISEDKVYAWTRRNSDGTTGLATYTLSGNTATYDADSYSPITLPSPTGTDRTQMGVTFDRGASLLGITLYNNKLYILVQYQYSGGRGRSVQLLRYSLSGTLEARLGWFDAGYDTSARKSYDYLRGQSIGGMQIFDDKLYIAGQRQSINDRTQRWGVRAFYVFPSITATGRISPETEFSDPEPQTFETFTAILATYNRIYVQSDNTTILRAYNHSAVRQTLDDVRFNVQQATTLGNTNQFQDRAFSYSASSGETSRPIRTFNLPQYASWGTPSVSDSRVITTELSIAENPGTTFATSDFKVEKRSGAGTSGDPYTWAEETTGWTITAEGSAFIESGTRWIRNIIATPAGSVGGGSYRVVLNEDAFGTDKPNADVFTDEVRFANAATASWGSPSFSNATGKLSATLTFAVFNITGIETTDFAVINSSGVEQTGWTFDAPSATATAGTAITISVLAPNNTNESFGLRLKATSVRSDGSSIDNTPTANTDSTTVSVNNTPSAVATASWSNTEYSNGKLQGTLTFAVTSGADTSITEISAADFAVINSSNVEQNGWVFDTPSATATAGTGITIAAAPPSGTIINAGFSLRLKATSVRSDRSLTDNAPSANVDFASDVTVDTRAAITATWGTLPATTQRSATINLTITFSDSIPSGQLTNNDFIVTGGTGGSVSNITGSGATYTITVTQPTNYDGNYTVSLKADAIATGTNYLEGPDSAVTTGNIDCDTRAAITATWTTIPSGTQTAATIDLVLTFPIDIASAQLTPTDFSATRGSVTNVTGSGRVYTVTVTQPTNYDGTYTVSLSTNALPESTTYFQGPTAAVTTTNIDCDTRAAITAQWGTLPTGTQRSATITIPLTFGRSIAAAALTTDDFDVSNGGSVTGVTRVSGTSYTITVTQPTNYNGPYTVTLDADSIPNGDTYLEGPDNDVVTGNINCDTRSAITATWGTLPTGDQTTETITLDLTFGQSIADSELTNSDFTVTGGTGGSVTGVSGSGTDYTITVTQPTNYDGTYTVSLEMNALPNGTTYLQGPTADLATGNINCDTRRAITASWTSVPTTPQTGTTVDLTLTFGRSIADGQLTTGDFSSTQGSITTVTKVSGTVYTITVTQPEDYDGNYTVTLNANAVDAGTSYLSGPTASVTTGNIDCDTREALDVTSFGLTTGSSTGTNTATREFTLVFNEEIPHDQLDRTEDFTLTSGATVASISPTSGNHNTYTVTVTQPTNDEGTYNISLDVGAVEAGTTYLAGPVAGDTNRQVTGTSYDTRAAITAQWSNVPTETATSATVDLTLTFGFAVPKAELANTEITATGGATIASITPATGTQAEYTVRVTQPTNSNGTYTVSLAADSIPNGDSYLEGPDNAVTTGNIAYNTRVAATAAWSSVSYTSGKLTGTMTFTVPAGASSSITEISAADFVVVNSSGVEQSGWIFDAVTSPKVAGTGFSVSAAPPTAAVNASFRLRLKATSVRSDGSTTDNAPTANVDSSAVSIDTRAAITAQWGTLPAGTQTSATITLDLTFGQSIDSAQLTNSDFEVSNSGSVTGVSGSGTSYTITVTQPTNYNGPYTVSLKANSLPNGTAHLAGPTTAVTTGNIDCDTRSAITASWSRIPANTAQRPLTGATVNLEITFGQDIPRSELSFTDFEVVGGTGGSVSGISPPTGTHNEYSITVTQPTNYNGTYKVRLKSNAVPNGNTYLEGPDSNEETVDINCDTVSAITANWRNLPTTTQSSGTIDLDLEFDRAVPRDQLVFSDFTGTNGASVTAISGTSGTSYTDYTITVTQPTDYSGTYTIELNANSIESGTNYRAGPSNPRRTANITCDTRFAITAEWSGEPAGTQTDDTIELTLTFLRSRSVPRGQLDSNDFMVSNGGSVSTISPTSGSHESYTITVTQPTHYDGTYTVSLKANAISSGTTYLAGPATVVTSDSIDCDTRKVITVTSFGEKPRTATGEGTATRELEIVFSQPVPAGQLAVSEFRSNNADITTSSIDPTSGSNTEYTITVNQAIDKFGDYKITFAADSIPDGTTYLEGPSSAEESSQLSFDRRSAITATWSVPTNSDQMPRTGSTVDLTLTFNHAIPAGQLDADNDFVVIGGTGGEVSNITGSGTTYTITVTQPTNPVTGTYTVSLNMNSVESGDTYLRGPTAAVTTDPINYNTKEPIEVRSLQAIDNSDPAQEAPTRELRLVFSMPVLRSQLSPGSFISNRVGVTIGSINPPSGRQAEYTIIVNQPTASSGTYRITLPMDAIIADSNDNYLTGPDTDFVSDGIGFGSVITANWNRDDVRDDGHLHPEPNRDIIAEITLNKEPDDFDPEQDFFIEVWNGTDPITDNNNWSRYTDQDDWTITNPITVDGSVVKIIKASPDSAVPAATYRITLMQHAFGTDSPSENDGSPPARLAAQAMPTVSVSGTQPASGFREAILNDIETRICNQLIIDEPTVEFQNDIAGYQNLYRLKFNQNDQVVIGTQGNIPSVVPNSEKENAYMAPRRPKIDGYSTPLRKLYCRPITNKDVTGIRNRGNRVLFPTAFVHIIDGEKDIYWPQRNNPVQGRLNHQVEYLKVAIDCVLRNEAEPDPATNTLGNGEYWKRLIEQALPIPALDAIHLQGLLTGTYQPQYHRTINQQSVQFVQDLELLLQPETFRSRTYKYGLNDRFEASVMNVNLAIWGMLPDSQNSPTDTVRCVFELEIHYPKTSTW